MCKFLSSCRSSEFQEFRRYLTSLLLNSLLPISLLLISFNS